VSAAPRQLRHYLGTHTENVTGYSLLDILWIAVVSFRNADIPPTWEISSLERQTGIDGTSAACGKVTRQARDRQHRR